MNCVSHCALKSEDLTPKDVFKSPNRQHWAELNYKNVGKSRTYPLQSLAYITMLKKSF